MRYKNRKNLSEEELKYHSKHCCYIAKCGYRCSKCDNKEYSGVDDDYGLLFYNGNMLDVKLLNIYLTHDKVKELKTDNHYYLFKIYNYINYDDNNNKDYCLLYYDGNKINSKLLNVNLTLKEAKQLREDNPQNGKIHVIKLNTH